MTGSYKKYDVVVVRFPFASSTVYKAQPAVIISSDFYNQNSRNTVFVLGISSQVAAKLDFEPLITHWQAAGLLKPSLFKVSIATLEQDGIQTKLGTLHQEDREQLNRLIQKIIMRD